MEETVANDVLASAHPKPKRKRILLKLSLLATSLALGYLAWQIGSGFIAGVRLSDEAVRAFHSQLDSGTYDEILKGSDDTFLDTEHNREVEQVFAGVHEKLGASRSSTRTNISVAVSTRGTSIKVAYQSTFEKGNAIETFTWRQAPADGRLLLLDYNVQSNAFLSNEAPSRSQKNPLRRF